MAARFPRRSSPTRKRSCACEARPSLEVLHVLLGHQGVADELAALARDPLHRCDRALGLRMAVAVGAAITVGASCLPLGVVLLSLPLLRRLVDVGEQLWPGRADLVLVAETRKRHAVDVLELHVRPPLAVAFLSPPPHELAEHVRLVSQPLA